MNCSFKLAHYQETLMAYKDAGYTTCSFRNWQLKRPSKFLVMRHDLDFQDSVAADMAFSEQVYGATATYLVRMHGRYNPFSYEMVKLVRSLSGFGHEVGLHFEQFDGDNNSKAYLDRMREAMQQVYKVPVETIAQHYSATDTIDLSWYDSATDMTFHGWRNGGKYLSDSGGRWRENCFCQWIDKEPHLFVNVHPVWWYRKCPQENF